MKIRTFLAATAMLATTVNPILTTAAWADTVPDPTADAANPTTLAEMQNQCDALAAAHDIDGAAGDNWTGTVVPGAVTKVSGPTEVVGSRVIDNSTIQGSGTPTYGGISIAGEPYRIGGSVNMFGDQRATEKNWPASTYNFTADFDSTFAHAFSCDIYQEVYHPEVVTPGTGHYVFNDDGTGSDEDAVRANCEQYTDHNQPWWGEPYRPSADNPRCKFEGTLDDVDPAHYDDPVLVGNEPGTAVNQDQTDSLVGFEDEGGPVTETGNFFIGQVVICISPTTTTQVKKGVPGTWVWKNGYTGGNCTTDWFYNHAQWGGGSQDSNGTYISVPAI